MFIWSTPFLFVLFVLAALGRRRRRVGADDEDKRQDEEQQSGHDVQCSLPVIAIVGSDGKTSSGRAKQSLVCVAIPGS